MELMCGIKFYKVSSISPFSFMLVCAYWLSKTEPTHFLDVIVLSRLSQGLVIKVLVFRLQNSQTFLKVLFPLLERRLLNWRIFQLLQLFQMMLEKR